jgi:hypothetical protein
LPAASAAAKATEAADAAVAPNGANDKKRKRSGISGDEGGGCGGGDSKNGNSDASIHSSKEENGRGGGSGGDSGTAAEIRELLHDKLTSDDVPEVESALETLANMCKADKNEATVNSQMIGDLGGCQTVLFLMRRAVKTVENEGVVVQSLRFLANWVGKSRDNCNTFHLLEGLTAVRDAMGAFPANGYLQRVGCAAFYNFNRAGKAEKAVVDDMLRAGAIHAIVRTMKAHLGDSDLQRFGCILLDDVSRAHPSLWGFLLQTGVLSALSGAYETHARTCPWIRHRGRRAIKTLVLSVG